MQPPNAGRRIQIRVNGKQRTGYYDNGKTVGWFYMRMWFEFPALTLDQARDAMRSYFFTLDALNRGVSPENVPNANSGLPK